MENWNLIKSTRAIVEAAAAGTSLKRLYDLSAEDGGQFAVDAQGNVIGGGYNKEYTTTIWQMYWSTYGNTDTVGFSVAPAADVANGPDQRMWRTLSVYDSVGVRPKQHAVDIYPLDGGALFASVLDELNQFGEGSKQLTITETFYNDPGIADTLFRIASQKSIKLRTIMQWPMRVNGGNPERITPDFANYGSPLPRITSSGLGCTGNVCGWVLGYNFTESCKVELYVDHVAEQKTGLLGLGTTPNCRDQEVDFGIPDSIRTAHPSVEVVVTNAFGARNLNYVIRTR